MNDPVLGESCPVGACLFLNVGYALEITRFLKGATAMFSTVETQFNAVERVIEYSKDGLEYDSVKRSDNMTFII